jgi:hypothetical protein
VLSAAWWRTGITTLIKPMAFVVLRPGIAGPLSWRRAQQFVRERLAE